MKVLVIHGPNLNMLGTRARSMFTETPLSKISTERSERPRMRWA